jgi:hypothetical protein
MYELQHKAIVLTKLHDDPDYDFIDMNVYYFSNSKWIIKKATKKSIDMLIKKRISEKKGIFELIDGCMWRSEWLTDIAKLDKFSSLGTCDK